METLRSACPLDCPDACSLEVRVESGRLMGLDGTELNPFTAGFLCGKVKKFERHLYSAERITRPALRSRGPASGMPAPKGATEFREVSWDEALGHVAERLAAIRDEHGGEALLPLAYGGSNGRISDGAADALLFRRLGASRLLRTVCAAPTTAAWDGLFGDMPGAALGDYEHARLIVVWGANPHVSNVHLVPVIGRARAAGARVVVVDPRRTQLAAGADLHLAPRPGTDLPLALAVLRTLFEGGGADERFLAEHTSGAEELRARAAPWTTERAGEESGVPARDIERLAAWFAETSPAVVRCGWGLERNRNGGSAAAAVLALAAVGGKFGVRGGGVTCSNSRAWRGVLVDPAGAGPATREVNMNHVGRALAVTGEGALHGLFVYNANPLVTLPNQRAVRRGLEREDLFTVVFDQVWTETARYADVVLPATTFLEHDDLRAGYGAQVLQRSRPVVARVGEARSNHEVFTELAERLGLFEPGDPRTPDDWAALGVADADTRAALDANDIAFPSVGDAPVQFADVFPSTRGRRVELVPEALDAEAPGGLYTYRPDPATAEFPLALISPADGRQISSTFGQIARDRARVAIHPEAAAARGVLDGDTVRLWNAQAELRCRARITDTVGPGTLSLAKGLWAHRLNDGEPTGDGPSALAPDTLTDLAGGACFNDARVQLERVD